MRPSSVAVAVGSTLLAVCLSVTAVTAPWLCAWLLLAGVFVTAWIISWRTSHDVFAPLLPVAGYLFLGIGVRGLALREGWVPNTYSVPLSNGWLMASVFLLGALATGCCIMGYRSRAGQRLGHGWLSRHWATTPYTPQIVTWFCVAAAGVGVLSLVLLRQRFGSTAGFGETPAVVASQVSKGGQFVDEMLAYFPIAGFLVGWRRRGMGVVGRLATLANFGLVVTWFLLAGRKSLLFELILGIFILQHYLRRRIRGRVLVAAVVPALVLVSLAFYFKAYGFRTHSIEEQYSQRPAVAAVVDPLLSRSYDFDAAEMILAKTKSVDDYRLGSTLDELLWFYIPRQWWPSKPQSFSFTFGTEFFGAVSPNVSYAPSMMGELYLNFGVIGVMAGFYLLGVALRACYEGLALRKTQLTAVLYTIVLFRLTNMIEGPIAGHVEFLLAEFLPVAVLIGWNGFAASNGSTAGRAPVSPRAGVRPAVSGPR